MFAEVNDNVVADYYAFGGALPGRAGSASAYRYGYQGSEKDNEIAGDGNSYTTLYRALDVRLGRWFSVDPKAAAQPYQTPYCSMDGNPVVFNDQLGDKVDPNSKGEWDNQKLATNNRISELEKKKTKILNKEKINKRNQSKLEYINRSLDELSSSIREMNLMEDSQELTYHITKVEDDDEKLAKEQADGMTSRNGTDVFIRYKGSRGSATLAHELSHGYNQLIGEEDQLGFTYDIYDEQRAFARGFAYTETYKNWSFKSYDDVSLSYVKNLYGDKVSDISLNKQTAISIIIASTSATQLNKSILQDNFDSNVEASKIYRVRNMGMMHHEAKLKAIQVFGQKPLIEFYNF